MIVYRERAPRQGRNICHIFSDCRVLAGKEYDVARVDGDDTLIPTCKGCKSGVTVPGHDNDRGPQ